MATEADYHLCSSNLLNFPFDVFFDLTKESPKGIILSDQDYTFWMLAKETSSGQNEQSDSGLPYKITVFAVLAILLNLAFRYIDRKVKTSTLKKRSMQEYSINA